jgi:Trypsin-co-occurring domain 2
MNVEPSLGELIRAVRRELESAHAADADSPLRLEVGTVELDLDVEVTRTRSGEGGIDVKVLRAGGSLASARGTTTKMHVVLTPRDLRTSDGKYDVSGLDTEPPPQQP